MFLVIRMPEIARRLNVDRRTVEFQTMKSINGVSKDMTDISAPNTFQSSRRMFSLKANHDMLVESKILCIS